MNEPAEQHISLVDLLDRLLGDGVVIGGDLVLSIDDINLVRVSLHAIVSSVGALEASHGR
ncbi:MAG TPA: gas vesicle protein [Pseudonocardiaceae bacterium]|nr:gas vesicle protein [Pseudonocardiaceae bacterium]